MEEYDVQSFRIYQTRQPQRLLSYNRAFKRLPEECRKATEQNSMSENTNSDQLREMSRARMTQKGKKPFYWLKGKDNELSVELAIHKQATNHLLSSYSTACEINLRGQIITVLQAPVVLGSALHSSRWASASNNTRTRCLLLKKNKRCIWMSL